MDQLEYVRKRLLKHKKLWPDIVTKTKKSQRTLYKIANDNHLPSYSTLKALYDYFKEEGK